LFYLAASAAELLFCTGGIIDILGNGRDGRYGRGISDFKTQIWDLSKKMAH